MSLGRADLESTLSFLADVEQLELDQLYAPEFLARLQDLIRCDEIAYQEYEYQARRTCFQIGLDHQGPYRWGAADGEPPQRDDDDLYWRVGPCPIVLHRIRERSLEAVRMSDVIPNRRFRELPVYRDYFRVSGIDQMLDLGLPARSQRQRSLILFRSEGARDFTERDRALLELLRPYLYHLEAHAALRRRLEGALRVPGSDGWEDGVYARLTRREREIVDLVAEGKTNAEIAARLWVAPSTVKKHLEHVYAKIGVGRRAAVAASRSAAHV